MTYSKKKILKIIVIFIVIFIIISVLYLFLQKPTKKANLTQRTTKSVESQTLSDVGIVYYGLDEFYNIGMTNKQVNKIKSYFKIFSTESNQKISNININKSSIKHTISKANKVRLNILNFEITINKTDRYNTKITYKNFVDPTMEIFNLDNKSIFKSPNLLYRD